MTEITRASISRFVLDYIAQYVEEEEPRLRDGPIPFVVEESNVINFGKDDGKGQILSLSSLDFASLVMELEDHFGFSFENHEELKATTARQLIDIAAMRLGIEIPKAQVPSDPTREDISTHMLAYLNARMKKPGQPDFQETDSIAPDTRSTYLSNYDRQTVLADAGLAFGCSVDRSTWEKATTVRDLIDAVAKAKSLLPATETASTVGGAVGNDGKEAAIR